MVLSLTLLFRAGSWHCIDGFLCWMDIEDIKYFSCNLDVNVKSLSSLQQSLLDIPSSQRNTSQRAFKYKSHQARKNPSTIAPHILKHGSSLGRVMQAAHFPATTKVHHTKSFKTNSI